MPNNGQPSQDIYVMQMVLTITLQAVLSSLSGFDLVRLARVLRDSADKTLIDLGSDTTAKFARMGFEPTEVLNAMSSQLRYLADQFEEESRGEWIRDLFNDLFAE